MALTSEGVQIVQNVLNGLNGLNVLNQHRRLQGSTLRLRTLRFNAESELNLELQASREMPPRRRGQRRARSRLLDQLAQFVLQLLKGERLDKVPAATRF
jgi:hypothetical protein